ncbi:hypothetical protein DFH09DRAFT_1101236 [Mycena vulgaris]|nr:hypothetical protein DFH09DRAFT_1101236 [Mycena vulgaris]
MWITLSSVAGCDMIKRGPLRFQKGEHRGGLEDCVRSDEWRRVECGIKTIPSLAILSCIFRGALQENLISKNEAIDWMTASRCAGDEVLEIKRVSGQPFLLQHQKLEAKTERIADARYMKKTYMSAAKFRVPTMKLEPTARAGIHTQHTDVYTSQCIDSARKSGPAAEEKPEAKTRRRAPARFRDRNSASPQKKTTQGGHSPNVPMTRPGTTLKESNKQRK